MKKQRRLKVTIINPNTEEQLANKLIDIIVHNTDFGKPLQPTQKAI